MTTVAHSPDLPPGFTDLVFDSQAVFRTLMSATAYPGRLFPLDRAISAPRPLNAASTALCLSLVDFETPLWLDAASVSIELLTWLRFHCGAATTDDSRAARFAVVADISSMPRLADFHAGDIEYPDRSTTLIVEVPALIDGPAVTWTGPGIKDSTRVSIAGLPNWFWPDWGLNNELYPLGLDIFFTCGSEVIGLPRTIRVEA